MTSLRERRLAAADAFDGQVFNFAKPVHRREPETWRDAWKIAHEHTRIGRLVIRRWPIKRREWIDTAQGSLDASDQNMGEKQASNFIQWKGTDVCMDFYCRCGASSHIDGYFAYNVRCLNCETVYELATQVAATAVSPDDAEHLPCVQNMEPR